MIDPRHPRIRVWALAQVTMCLCAVSLLSADAETVLVTGPLMVAVGLLQLFLAKGSQPLRALGVGNCGVVALATGVILLFGLSPGDAYALLLPMGIVWSAASAGLALSVHNGTHFRRALPAERDRLPWHCIACGYPLVGVAGSACPECGAAFDHHELRRLMREMLTAMDDAPELSEFQGDAPTPPPRPAR